jgi:transposase
MAAERLSMRQIREILRQKWALGLSHRAVSRSVGLGLGTISSVLTRAQAAGLDWPQVQLLTDDVLESRLYGRPEVAGQRQRPAPDCAWIHAERHQPGVTLELLHLEYLERHPDGYRYTRFCDLYRRWLKRRGLSMRQVHRAGEKCFVDYAGQKPRLIEPATGEIVTVELFVAVLGASNYTYAEATRTQQVPDWLASHARAFAFFGGVTSAVVCDQLKSGVVVPCRYEPGLQRTYEEFAAHYGTAILPARPAKPRDKAKIEVAVQIAERWIVARLRHETFFSLGALNARIAELLTDLNARRMRRYGVSRHALFARLDQPALRPLPPAPFLYGEWVKARVNIDYHVEVHRHLCRSETSAAPTGWTAGGRNGRGRPGGKTGGPRRERHCPRRPSPGPARSAGQWPLASRRWLGASGVRRRAGTGDGIRRDAESPRSDRGKGARCPVGVGCFGPVLDVGARRCSRPGRPAGAGGGAARSGRGSG